MGGSRQGEREREKRKHSEFSLTVIISTLPDGSRGVKKRRRWRTRAKPNVCVEGGCRGPAVSCLTPHCTSLAKEEKSERGIKGNGQRKTAALTKLCQNGSGEKLAETEMGKKMKQL